METIDILEGELTASRIGLGTWAVGGWMWGGTEEHEAIAAIDAALDCGITLIDTAPVYGFGRSEEIVGRALAENGRRDEVVLATKVALDWDEDEKPFRNARPERIEREVEDSLRRLRTDVIDLYQVHWPDPATPIEDTAEAMRRLHESGKIRAVGVSNFSPEQMRVFSEAAPLHTTQPPYNLFERGVETDVLPWAHSHGVKTVTYGVLCRGLLSGKMGPERSFRGDDLRQFDPKFRQPRFSQYLRAVDAIADLARERFDVGILPFAVRWALDHGADVALWGARRPEQLEDVDRLWGWRVDESAMVDVDEILRRHVADPVGPEFMAPPAQSQGEA